MKIYLAGKIKKNDWRETILTPAQKRNWSYPDIGDYDPGRWTDWPVAKGAVFDEHDYVGPYFIDCDHGCYHGPTDHGVGATGGGCGGGATRNQVFELCRRAIRRCDVFFAWIDNFDAFGTLVEAGYADALGKPIWVAFDPELDRQYAKDMEAWERFLALAPDGSTGEEDAAPPWARQEPRRNTEELWFLQQAASWVCFDAASPREALLQKLSTDLRTMPYADYLKTEHWQIVRAAALEFAEHRCQLCNSADRLNVHHRTYERRGAEEPGDVIVLCHRCHGQFHQVINGRPTRTVR